MGSPYRLGRAYCTLEGHEGESDTQVFALDMTGVLQTPPDSPEIEEDRFLVSQVEKEKSERVARAQEDIENIVQQVGSPHGHRWDMFLSHLQRNGQDAIISMLQFLKAGFPGLKCFIDLEVDMKGELEKTLRDGVLHSRCFLFFITDGVLTSRWCLQEMRWAVQFKKNIVLVRETDERHGGLAMNKFLEQVPEDLQTTFRNIIAIPWYREPKYREISVASILQASGLKNTLVRDLDEMRRSTNAFPEVFMPDPDALTVIEVMCDYSLLMRYVFFIGGFLRFKQYPIFDRLYGFAFAFSFWYCGLVCTMNIVYKGVPYHILSTDALTAYVHLLGWQGWARWRQFVNSNGLEELLTTIKGDPQNNELMKKASRIGGAVMMFLQVAMATDVLFGFSLPYEVLSRQGAVHNWIGHGHETFAQVHARSMWFVIPPVIASIFCSYSLFAFVAFLHLLDTEGLKAKVLNCASVLTRHNQQLAPEPLLFATVSEQVYLAIGHTQRHIDHTCKKLGWLWVHSVFFSTLQVLSVLISLAAHLWGTLVDVHYTWWWGLQDFFHLGGGIVLLSAAMGIWCTVTTMLNRVPSFAFEALREAGCPPDRLGSLWGLLDSRPLGMHVFCRAVFIDVPKAAAFFLSIVFFIILMAIITADKLDAA